MTVLTPNIAKPLKQLENAHWFVLFAVVFRIFLELSYFGFVNPYFAYLGFGLDVDTAKYIESWLIFSTFVLLFPKKLLRVSDFLLAYLLFVFITPLLVLFSMTNAPRAPVYFVALGAVLVYMFRSGKPLRIPLLRGGPGVAYFFVVAGAAIVTMWMIYSGGFGFFNLDFSRVYELRSNAGEIIEAGPMGYVITWATKVFGPVLLAVALWKKRLLVALSIVGLHVIWFGVSAHKAVVFYPFLVIFLWLWFQNTRALSLVPAGMAFIVAIAFGLFLVVEEIFVGSLLIRRTFFVPANLTFAYYEFFSENTLVFWSNSITAPLMDYPYDVNPAALIGRYMGTDSHANNSFLATGYMHAGLAGIVLYGVVVGLLFRVIDSLANNGLPPWVAVAAIIVPSQSLLVGADLPTAILTHGIGISIVILFLLRSSASKQIAESRILEKPGYRFSSVGPHVGG